MALRRLLLTACVASLLGIAACTQSPKSASSAATTTNAAAPAISIASIAARGETTPVSTTNDDAADDPAIWRNAADPEKSLVIGTDKKGGLYVYDLNGAVKSFLAIARVNNVDLLGDVMVNGKKAVLVGASDREDIANGQIALYTLDTTAAKLTPIGRIPAGKGEAYGFCLGRSPADNQPYAFVVFKDGTITQVKLDTSVAAAKGEIVRTMKVATQAEGCVVDNRTSTLYVAEEDVGIWKFSSAANGPTQATGVAKVDKKQLTDDAEGLALDPIGDKGGYLIVSSQGDNSYTVYDLETDAFAGKFNIPNGPSGIGGTSDTDGIELALGSFGPNYPEGLFIAQDGDNAPRAQNFKLVSWAEVKAALKLK